MPSFWKTHCGVGACMLLNSGILDFGRQFVCIPKCTICMRAWPQKLDAGESCGVASHVSADWRSGGCLHLTRLQSGEDAFFSFLV